MRWEFQQELNTGGFVRNVGMNGKRVQTVEEVLNASPVKSRS